MELHLRRVVDGFGLRCFDPHQHAAPSADSAVSLVDRAASDLAEGLDVMVATDHNAASVDWTPRSRRSRHSSHPARPLTIVVGDEVSLERFGHFSVIPMPRSAEAKHGATPELGGRTPRQVLRSLAGPGRVVVLNHPRGGDRTGYFENVGIDDKAVGDRSRRHRRHRGLQRQGHHPRRAGLARLAVAARSRVCPHRRRRQRLAPHRRPGGRLAAHLHPARRPTRRSTARRSRPRSRSGTRRS